VPLTPPVSFSAFDLLELDGNDLQQWLFEERKRVLATCCAGSATVSPSMRSVAASKPPPSSGAQPTSQLISAASKLPKTAGIVDLALLTQNCLTRGLASCCCCRFLLLRSSEVKHLPAYSVCNATEQGTFHVDAGNFLVEQAKFRSCVSAFYAGRAAITSERYE
jgi:hypothetical protein